MKPFHLILSGLLTAALYADVKTEEKNLMKFEGMMGRFVGMFGGKAAREGQVNTVAVRGNRKMTANDMTGQIIDLDEEKVYELDMRGKSYRVVTFAELRQRMQEAQERMSKMPREGGEQPAARQQGEPQMEIDVSAKESGQKKNINGFDCREVVMTVTARQKGKTLEEGGGMVMTSNLWLGPKIAAMKEIEEFDRRYAEKMAGVFGIGAEQMAMALAMYPAMKEMMGKLQAENVNMDGTAILTVMTMESVRNPAQAGQEQSQQQPKAESGADVTSVRGLGGLIGRRMARRKAEGDTSAPSQGGTPNRSVIMSTTHELVKVSTQLGPADLGIPAGFREKK